jgi:hypothetical protein
MGSGKFPEPLYRGKCLFVLDTEASYSWPVHVSLPKDGGTWQKSTFDATFKRIPQSRLKKILNDEDATDANLCREILVGWKGIKSLGGDEVPFSESSLDSLLEVPGLATTIVKAYLESIAGAKTKN